MRFSFKTTHLRRSLSKTPSSVSTQKDVPFIQEEEVDKDYHLSDGEEIDEA